MKFRNMVKAGLVLGFGLSLVGCGTCHHGKQERSYGGGCVSAGDKALTKQTRVAQITKAIKKAPKVAPVTKVISSTYAFGFDNAKLEEMSKAELDKYADFLAKNPNTRIRIEGHTDEKGKSAYNVALGKRRAESVASYLIEQGVPSENIEVYSYGSENPVDFGNTAQAYAKNRRVELFFETNSSEMA